MLNIATQTNVVTPTASPTIPLIGQCIALATVTSLAVSPGIATATIVIEASPDGLLFTPVATFEFAGPITPATKVTQTQRLTLAAIPAYWRTYLTAVNGAITYNAEFVASY